MNVDHRYRKILGFFHVRYFLSTLVHSHFPTSPLRPYMMSKIGFVVCNKKLTCTISVGCSSCCCLPYAPPRKYDEILLPLLEHVVAFHIDCLVIHRSAVGAYFLGLRYLRHCYSILWRSYINVRAKKFGVVLKSTEDITDSKTVFFCKTKLNILKTRK